MPLNNLDESPLLGFAGYSSQPLLFAGLVSRAPLKARFINVLVSPVLLREFLEFCALPSELALEPLLFVLDVERFRHAQPSMARLLANYIYLTYIAPSAPLRINASGRMRDRIPWPFLPGWEYNPWVFDEILASVGFTLKKHTLLRFERSPVGLASLFASPGFRPKDYVRPLRFDHECDPMAAIAEHFEPDIDVVIWVNDLEFDASGTQLLTNLSHLTDTFRERLLERISAQFVGDQRARSLCDGYFRLATRIVPLQKQRKIKKTRKLCNFFGDNPHEALLRQQLMAVVPPSSHAPAARAAAELVARKKAELPPQTTSNGWSSSDNENENENDSENDNDNDNDDDADEANIDNASTLGYFTERHMRTLDRALSMIGMPNTADSHDSAGSSAGNSPCEPPQRLPTISIFERKKRVDKLREFFGRTTDPAASSLETVHESSAIDDSHLTHAQRQLLVRRRRKLKAILGEQVDECIIGLSPSVSFDEEKEEEVAAAGCEEKSLRNMRIRQYSKIREVLGEAAPIPNVAPVSPPATDSVDSSSSSSSSIISSVSIRSISSSNSGSSSSSSSSYEFVPVESSDPIRPVRAQFWMTSSPESQASVVSSEPHNTKRSSLMATLRARKASIIGSIKRATPSTSNLRGGIPGCSGSNFINNNNSSSSSISNTTGAFLPSRAGARDKVPARSTSIRPLSPLPPISPNNFEASFDRGMALREVVSVAEYISGKSMVPPRTSSARKTPTTAAPVHTPTNIVSSLSRPSAISASTAAAAAGSKVTTATANTTTNSNVSAAFSKPCAAVAGPANYSRAHGTAPATSSFAAHSTLASTAGSSSGKTVHWFDSPEVVNYPATPSPDKESFHSAATDVGMSIILRSPSMKKPSIKSPPPIMPLRAPITTTTGFPMLSINSPPQMSLSHKASVSAVGGRRLEKVLSIVNEQQCDDRKLLLQQTMTAAPQQQQLPPLQPSSPSPACTNIVTIRARRSQSFAIRRKLERATVGRKRSNTIGTGKQTGVRTEEDSFKTHEKKKGRRVQSMITSTQLSSLLGNSRISRSRCVTVIPLRLELQRLAARSGRRRQQPRPSNRGYRRSNSELQRLPRRHPFNRRSCVLEYRKKPSVVPARSISNRIRSESCPSRFVAPKKELPIRPAVARYLSEVRSSSSSLPSSYGAYQRISLAQLAPNAQYGRRSLDTQAMARRKYSPYTAGIIRRYASVSAGIRIKEGGSSNVGGL
ncbi:hypothetical protein IWW48_005442 [Coemansia sp. RSA 1200]|nr:hypothetical protein IWW48_005442 [Coemansia sp. RSA 1200]